MAATIPQASTVPVSRPEHVFPTLTDEQVRRIAAHGRERRVSSGETLVTPGEPTARFYVVKSGVLEVVRLFCDEEELIATHQAGQFTGEVNMLSGRPALFALRVAEAGVVIEVQRENLVGVVQTDAELGEILMRAFILRRAALVANRTGDVVVVGSLHCSATLRVKEFLTRNGHPYSYLDLDTDSSVQGFLDHLQVAEDEIPVVICRGTTILRNPTNQQIADSLGFNDAIDQTHLRDVVVIGAGPSGLAAAVYAASEGLDTLVIESSSPGGQAGSSSRIENYLGFPTGISGGDLAARAYTQSQKFGAQLMIAKGATKLTCDRKPYTVETDGGQRVPAKAVIIASGALYRRLPVENISRFDGVGVYYGATPMEAQLCSGEEVVVVGGGNSAGQAVVFLAGYAKRVHMLVRGSGLTSTMSRYLIRRIEDNPAIVMRTHTELVRCDGDTHLENVEWRDRRTGESTRRRVRHVFVMTGADPSTNWLNGCVAVDDKGFIKTGPDLSPDDLTAANWPLSRQPYLLETSLPGVFAVGDVRAGNVKRVASAVGEGSIAVAFVHRVLQE